MDDRIRVIIKRPGEKHGHLASIKNTLENFQKIVGGYIEAVPYWPDTVIIVNEEGKLKGLKPNFYMGAFPYGDLIVGTAIVCGVDGEEFTDCPMSKWKWIQYLEKWGNY